jgi:hypothetical protein
MKNCRILIDLSFVLTAIELLVFTNYGHFGQFFFINFFLLILTNIRSNVGNGTQS